MNKIILVTGGARSGKSVFAEKCTYFAAGNRAYIATAQITDEEMAHRVKIHQERRAGNGWTNIEENYDLAAALGQARNCDAVLVDCLSVWIGNLMFRDAAFSEQDMARETDRLTSALKAFPGFACATNPVALIQFCLLSWRAPSKRGRLGGSAIGLNKSDATRCSSWRWSARCCR